MSCSTSDRVIYNLLGGSLEIAYNNNDPRLDILKMLPKSGQRDLLKQTIPKQVPIVLTEFPKFKVEELYENYQSDEKSIMEMPEKQDETIPFDPEMFVNENDILKIYESTLFLTTNIRERFIYEVERDVGAEGCGNVGNGGNLGRNFGSGGCNC